MHLLIVIFYSSMISRITQTYNDFQDMQQTLAFEKGGKSTASSPNTLIQTQVADFANCFAVLCNAAGLMLRNPHSRIEPKLRWEWRREMCYEDCTTTRGFYSEVLCQKLMHANEGPYSCLHYLLGYYSVPTHT